MIGRRTLLGMGITAGALGIAGGVTWSAYAAALRPHRERIASGSALAPSRFGPVEYAVAGRGEPVLMIHGAGGGFDQGIAFTHRLAVLGHRIVAPSRFGYLRSSNPAEPTPENQADAFADLLDALQLTSVAVIGGSAGALSAMQFAARHPGRCRSLTLIVPAAFASQGMLPPQSPMTKAVIEWSLNSDFLFWLGATVARDQIIKSILATDPALVAAASEDERRRVDDILWNILPISERSRGLLNDARFTGTPQSIPLERITAPTLAISLEDDLFATIGSARLIAAKVRGARLVTYPTGGHVWVGRDAELFAEVDAFLKAH
jgi:2-hydroxy-6-oxonona-2,4-dienedioate hydrolase